MACLLLELSDQEGVSTKAVHFFNRNHKSNTSTKNGPAFAYILYSHHLNRIWLAMN